MILHDEAIADAIDSGRIVIEPDLDPEAIQPASLDVRLGEDVWLEPGECFNAWTVERITLPNDLAALLTGRSSVGRKHVSVHCTAGWLDPGFDGTILLEMINHSEYVATYPEGKRIAQIIFFECAGESSGYDGQYQGQGPGGR